jgi:predicted transposase YbfD/YdcC
MRITRGPASATRSAPEHQREPGESTSMSPKQIAAIVAAAALATLRQIPGIDPEMIEDAARAIGNNAAQVIAMQDDED